MIIKTLNAADYLLGKADEAKPFFEFLPLRVERSDALLEYQVTNLNRDLSLTTRPQGVLLTSLDNDQNAFYFGIIYSEINSVSILKSYSKDLSYKFSYTMAGIFTILFAGIVYYETHALSLSFLLLSLVFGITVSGLFTKRKRQNMHIRYREEGK